MEALGINLGLLIVQIIAFIIVIPDVERLGLQAHAEHDGNP